MAKNKSSLKVVSFQMDEDDENLYEDLTEALRFHKDELDVALVEQPSAFFRISSRLEELRSQRDAAKQQVAVAEAEADTKVRRSTLDRDKKPTEGEVKASIRQDTDVSDANALLLRLNYTFGQFQALKEAFEQRSYSLKALVELYQANYFGASPDMSSSTTKFRNESGDRARQVMHQERIKRR